MEAANTGSSEGASPPTPIPSPRFEVTLAYQDLPTALHARQFLNHVLDHCQLGSDFNLTLWKLGMFHLPEIRAEGVRAACDAALILLSLRGDIGLEANTEHWLREWINRRQNDECALAVLIDCDLQRLDSVGQTLFRLQDLTRDSQVRLFVGFVPKTQVTPGSAWKPESDNTETIIAPPDKHPHSPDIRQGGIND